MSYWKKKRFLAVILIVLSAFGCLSYGGSQTAPLISYKAILWDYLEILCGFGPRNPGSPGHKKAAAFIQDIGERFADRTEVHRFTHVRPDGSLLELMNIEFHFDGTEEGRPVLLGTHFDTRPYADEEPDPALHSVPILGANDGGSGTAVLLGLARRLSRHKPKRPVRMVFFDGEDYGPKGGGGKLLGSIHYAARLEKMDKEQWPYCVLILDMVGDRQLEIFQETHSLKSAPWLVDLIYGLARKKNHTQFHNQIKYTIFDDHYPFVGLGIPSVVLIDFDYPHWHKLTDTLEQCSPESLYAVFSVVKNALDAI